MTSFDHRLGFPPALLAFESEPRKSQRTPPVQKLSEAEQAERRLLDVEPPAQKPLPSFHTNWLYCIAPNTDLLCRYELDTNTVTFWCTLSNKWLPSAISIQMIYRFLATKQLLPYSPEKGDLFK